jgi:hypothetical protein
MYVGLQECFIFFGGLQVGTPIVLYALYVVRVLFEPVAQE